MFDTIYTHQYEKADGSPATLKDRLNMRKCCGPYQWKPAKPGSGRGFYQSIHGLAMGDSTISLRLEWANNHLRGRLADINGYYTNSHQDETAKPVIARLPHSRGFLAGYTLGSGMCGAIAPDIYEDVEEAARAAHSEAERVAELNRESEDDYLEEEED